MLTREKKKQKTKKGTSTILLTQ